MKNLVSYFFLFSIIISCSTQDELTLNGLIEQGYYNPNDNLTSTIKSLNRLKDSTRYILINDSIDILNYRILLKFSEFSLGRSLPRDLYNFSICLNKESLSIDSKGIVINNVEFLASEYLKMDYLYTKLDTIDYIGITSIPEPLFEINIDNSKKLMIKDWKNVFTLIEIFNKVIDNSREELSLAHFGKKFKDLDFDKMKSIVQIRPKIFILSLGKECHKIPEPNVDSTKDDIYDLIK